MVFADLTLIVGVSKQPDGEWTGKEWFGATDVWIPADVTTKKVEKGIYGLNQGDGDVFAVRMCKVRGDKVCTSNVGDLIERDPIRGGAKQCSGKATTSDEFEGKWTDRRLGPATVEEKLGCPKMTRLGYGSSK